MVLTPIQRKAVCAYLSFALWIAILALPFLALPLLAVPKPDMPHYPPPRAIVGAEPLPRKKTAAPIKGAHHSRRHHRKHYRKHYRHYLRPHHPVYAMPHYPPPP